jgi:hypothetical protein
VLVAPRHSDQTDGRPYNSSFRLSIVEFRGYNRPTAYLKNNNNFPGAMQVPIQTVNDIFLQTSKIVHLAAANIPLSRLRKPIANDQASDV